jgi:hypothetical protein
MAGSTQFLLTALRFDGADEWTRLPAATQLSVIVLDVSALLIVAKSGIFCLAIFLLAAGLERVAIYLNVRAGLGIRAARAVKPVAIAIAIVVVVAVVRVMVIAVAAVSIVIVAIVASAIAISAAVATEISVQVLDLTVATLEVRELRVAPVAAFVFAGGLQG